ncbi:MAG: MFS transporter [Erysipelotrichaceae bacterium]|nr:MFS transporter [Erysipelotrichaceae bacterium]MDP3306473.1 MFS transporter [Erysipelotrichaceae bacterium]
MLHKKSSSLIWFFSFMMMELIFANLAHPATPALIKNLNLPDYTFGAAFASMAFTNFLFSPFWGKLSDHKGRVKLYMLACIGYAFGQFLFMQATTEIGIFVARGIAGFFIGGINVTHLTYVMDGSSLEDRAKNLTIHSTIFTLAGSMGYLIGGFLGNISIPLLFTVQVVGLIFSGIVTFLKMKEIHPGDGTHWEMKQLLDASNPFSAFKSASKSISVWVWVFFGVVFFSVYGSTAFDQAFNYYIRDQFGFPPSYNGILKAGVGILALLVNSTICMYLIRKTTMKKPLVWVMGLTALTGFAVLWSDQAFTFIAISILFFALNSIYSVLIQALAGKESRSDSTGAFMGMFSSMRALGMIFGSLLAGLIYAYGPKLAFVMAGVMFLVALVLMSLLIRYRPKSE